MQDIISNFTQTLVDADYFDIKDTSGKIFYKSSRLRDSEWYEKTKMAHELLNVGRRLDAIIEEFYCNQLLVDLLKNKTSLVVQSMPNTKYTLADVLFCLYLKEKNPNLVDVKLIKHVPVDEPWFIETPKCDIDVEIVDSTRPSKFVIDIEGHRLIL